MSRYDSNPPNLSPAASRALTEIIANRMRDTGETLDQAREHIAGFILALFDGKPNQ